MNTQPSIVEIDPWTSDAVVNRTALDNSDSEHTKDYAQHNKVRERLGQYLTLGNHFFIACMAVNVLCQQWKQHATN